LVRFVLYTEKSNEKLPSGGKDYPVIDCNRMKVEISPDISSLLVAWSKGDEKALKDVVPMVYGDLRRIARKHLGRRTPDHAFESGTLAHETYLKLTQARGIQCEHRAHFFALCAQMIRRILVDHARKQRSAKRGGDYLQIPLDEALIGEPGRGVAVLALDDALSSLSKFDPRKERVVELRYFAGLTVEETAEVLHISPETVMRDWKLARAWLYRELTGP
jgi:RNA polymerase sigma-70 factor (ECF subfamily)